MLLGRDSELASICGLLTDQSVRLLTLTGPGGVGKSCLAAAATARLAPQFPDGVTWVALADIGEPELVAPAIVQALGVRADRGQSPRQRIIAAIGDRRGLIVLDNFEQVSPAAPEIVALLAACPNLVVLVTSRVALRLSHEQEFAVGPLPLPGPSATLADVAGAAAIQLFARRARGVDPSFTLTPSTLPIVAEICHQLDGLPLAIELAARRSKALAPPQLLAMLTDRTAALAGGPLDAPARQRTMRATLDWSYDLLAPAEQAMFRRIAYFAGGATLEAVQAVCAVGRNERPTLLDLIAGLFDHSLLTRQMSPDDTPRYRMLGTIRDYGLEHLHAGPEFHQVAERHARYFTRLAERVEAQIKGPDPRPWLDRVVPDHDNIRAALAWSIEHGPIELGLRLAAAMRWFWEIRGFQTEGRAWLERALAKADDGGAVSAPVRAKALHAAGALALSQGASRQAEPYFRAALAGYRALDDLGAVGDVLNNLGWVAQDARDYATAASRYEESLAARRAVGDQRGAAITTHNLVVLVSQHEQNFAKAAELGAENLAQFRALNDARGIAYALFNLAYIASARGDHAQAMTRYDESLSRARALDDKQGMANALGSLGNEAVELGRFQHARSRFTESLLLFAQLGDQPAIAQCLEGLAAAADDPALGAWLLGAAEARWEAAGMAPPRAAATKRGQRLAAIRAWMAATGDEDAWMAGRAAPIAAVLARASELAAGAAPVDAPEAPALTRRQMDVLRLLVEGYSDREIAAALSISPRTVGVHVVSILDRLGVDSRTAAAARAVRTGLVSPAVGPDGARCRSFRLAYGARSVPLAIDGGAG